MLFFDNAKIQANSLLQIWKQMRWLSSMCCWPLGSIQTVSRLVHKPLWCADGWKRCDHFYKHRKHAAFALVFLCYKCWADWEVELSCWREFCAYPQYDATINSNSVFGKYVILAMRNIFCEQEQRTSWVCVRVGEIERETSRNQLFTSSNTDHSRH